MGEVMFLKVLIYIIGLILVSTGIVFTIIYLNLMNMGYSFLEYVNFIIRRLECLNIFIGSFLIILSLIIKKKGKPNDLYL